MSFKKYIILMLIATIISVLSFGIVVMKIDPTNSLIHGFILFYASLFFASVGVLSLLAIAIRWVFSNNKPFFSIIIKSFRQSILFSSTIVFSLILKSLDLLRWWNIAIFIACIIFIEFFFVSHKPGKKI